MKNMSQFLVFSMIIASLFGCKKSQNSQAVLYLEKCGMTPEIGFNAYLDKVISWQDSTQFRRGKAITFGVKVHFVGSDNNLNSKIEIDFLMAFLNETFAQANIKFKSARKHNFIKSNLTIDALFQESRLEDSICKGNYNAKNINLYIFEKSKDVVGYSHYPIQNQQRIFISRQKLFDPALVHEFGHFFGLLHTFEHLAGEEKITGTNCKSAGDKICDTPADPLGASFLEDDCKLYGNYQNAAGETFRPNMNNFMSYYGKCRHSFTRNQIDRMFFIAKNIKVDLAVK